MLEQRARIPFPDLGAEPLHVDRAHGEHDMRVRFGFTIGADIPMHIEIGDLRTPAIKGATRRLVAPG